MSGQRVGRGAVGDVRTMTIIVTLLFRADVEREADVSRHLARIMAEFAQWLLPEPEQTQRATLRTDAIDPQRKVSIT